MKNVIGNVKTLLRHLLPGTYQERLRCLFERYAITSYSQHGEDIIVRQILENYRTGFYVDVGAYHPQQYSNTFYFYKKGWRGINIDARPGSMELFNRLRPRDINLEMAVSHTRQTLPYHGISQPALNTFSKHAFNQHNSEEGYKVVFEKYIQTVPLSEILDQYLPEETEIELLSIDVEGFELSVLHSNNWEKYRPHVIIIEDLFFTVSKVNQSAVFSYLSNQGYTLIAKTPSNLIFIYQNVED